MYGVTALPSNTQHPHGISAMDAAAASGNNGGGAVAPERGYFRRGLRDSSPFRQMAGSGGYRPSTAASGRTTPMTNRSTMNLNVGVGAGGNVGGGTGGGGGVSSTGLIRLTLKKPMGIVFEPMADPHNPSQQRGVRICDLPRTGAAAMSGKLEIGDELLSINNKTMSRLTFDEIMDFIIEADADNVQLLFRRPKKDQDRTGAAPDSSKRSSNVKWVDSKDKKVVTEMIEPEVDPDQDTVGDETISTRSSSPPHRGKGKKNNKDTPTKIPNRDEESLYSGDETFYTETTDFTEETRQKTKRGRRGNRKIESESFLDMLIDSLCAPVIGDSGRGKNDDFSDDETYNSKDDDTYGTYDDDSYIKRKKKWDVRKRKEKERREKSAQRDKNGQPVDDFKENVPFEMNSNSHSKSHSKSKSSSFEPVSINDEEEMPRPKANTLHQQTPPPPPPPPPPPVSFGNDQQNFHRNQVPQANNNNMNMMNTNMNMNNNMNMMNNNMNMLGIEPQNRFEPNLTPKNDITEMSLTPDPNCPIAELEYDDQVDHAADVSVMDSIGGPSLLLENLRNASKIVKTVTPEVIQKHGASYPQELGLTREESIQVDPNKFYRWVVKNLLETHEPEKIRLIDKLFEKYKGREEHLIYKLSARYSDDEEKSKRLNETQDESNEDDGDDYDGFKAFGGSFSKSDSTKETGTKGGFENSGWPSTIGEEEEEEDETEENTQMNTSNDQSDDMSQSQDYTESDYESVDGTSPEVIAKVSELLNYVYGKTSVPGQIDRVSTIMRAYEGRTGVLLELLETKALLKANADTENDEEIPESLRENPGLKSEEQKKNENKEIQIHGGDHPEVLISPMSNFTPGSEMVERMTDSAPSTAEPMPKPISRPTKEEEILPFHTHPPSSPAMSPSVSSYSQSYSPSTDLSLEMKKKKKKGIFGMFKKKKKKGKNGGGGAFPSSDGGIKTPRSNKKGALLG